MANYYPIMADLSGRRCLVVGGGRVAERKIERLLECGAEVAVVSPACTPRIAELVDAGRIRLQRRTFHPDDVSGVFLVFAATDDAQVNREVADAVRGAKGLVNVADAPEACSFLVPSVIRRGDLTIAISTAGGSPALARKLRQRLEATIGQEYEAFVEALRELRLQAQARIADPVARQELYRRAVDSPLFEHAAKGDRTAVAACIGELLLQTRRADETPGASSEPR